MLDSSRAPDGTRRERSTDRDSRSLRLAAWSEGGQAAVVGLQGLRGADPVGPVSVVAATRRAGATAFGAPEVISEPGQFEEAAQAAFRQDGSIVAAWRSLQPPGVVWAVRPAP